MTLQSSTTALSSSYTTDESPRTLLGFLAPSNHRSTHSPPTLSLDVTVNPLFPTTQAVATLPPSQNVVKSRSKDKMKKEKEKEKEKGKEKKIREKEKEKEKEKERGKERDKEKKEVQTTNVNPLFGKGLPKK